MSTKAKSRSRRRRSRTASLSRWGGLLVVPLALAVLVAMSVVTEKEDDSPQEAVPFELATTAGQEISLDETLRQGDALLYFSMGVGCDGCFAQIPELEPALAERDISLMSIMVDPAPLVAREAARFGITSPILLDPGARVSSAYGMVGIYGHGDRPSHSFALVRSSGEIAWVRHYAEMFVPADALLSELDTALRS